MTRRRRVLAAVGSAVAVLLGSAVVASAPSGAAAGDLTPPVRAAFYYPWYPETENWATKYNPALGKYDSSNPTILATHMAQAKWAGLDAVIASWWGPGTPTDTRLPALLDAAQGQGVAVTPYYEREGQTVNPTVADIQADLVRLRSLASHPAWLHVGGKPVLFVYNQNDTTCAITEKWRQAAGTDWYLNLKVFSGYKACPVQPDSWHQYGPTTRLHNHSPFAMNVSPGFFKFNEAAPRLARDLNQFKIDLSTMADAAVQWKLVTSFNEWGEGTSVEPAVEWQSANGEGDYLTAMRQVFVEGQRFKVQPTTTASPTPTSATPTPSPSPSPTPTPSPSPSPSPTPTQPPDAPVTIAAAGDVSCEPGPVLDPKVRCAEPLTADTIMAMTPAGVLALGDLQYTVGALSAFQSEYDPAWGRFKSRTYPAPGNHEWGTANAQGYRDYFATGAPPQVNVTKLYYSYDLGAWHFVSLDSDCKGPGGCTATGEQTTWLKQDLAANDGKPTIAYWHHPRYTSDSRGDNAFMAPTWDVLFADRDVQLALSGHTHHYERFAPMGATGPDPTGLRQFVVGTGGRNHICPPAAKHTGSQITDCTTFGVLKLTLNTDGSYGWQFVAAAGAGTFTDSGTTQARR
jgi:hypothetical protein